MKMSQHSGAITLPAPSTVSWMHVKRPVPVSVNAGSHKEYLTAQ
jgi:hypothetical protein